MFFYLYDAKAKEEAYSSTIATIEGELHRLEITGHVERASLFKQPKETLVENVRAKKPETVVIVGDDQLLLQALNWLAPFNVAIGYLPLNPRSPLAALLGIPTGSTAAIEQACQLISKRRTITLPTVDIGGSFCVGNAEIDMQPGDQLLVNNAYTIRGDVRQQLVVTCAGDLFKAPATTPAPSVSLIPNTDDEGDEISRSADKQSKREASWKRWLPTVPQRLRRNPAPAHATTTIPLGELQLISRKEFITAHIDGASYTIGAPCIITQSPFSLSIIVGPDRKIGQE